MRFEYQITSFPADTSGYHLTAYTEGELRVLVGNAALVDASGILLVELAVVLHRWLAALEATPTDFYYASMDFEEEPILALRHDAVADTYRLESVWAAAQTTSVTRSEAVTAARRYLSELREELSVKHGIDLNVTMEEAMLDS